jgi:hypothetical protein
MADRFFHFRCTLRDVIDVHADKDGNYEPNAALPAYTLWGNIAAAYTTRRVLLQGDARALKAARTARRVACFCDRCHTRRTLACLRDDATVAEIRRQCHAGFDLAAVGGGVDGRAPKAEAYR